MAVRGQASDVLSAFKTITKSLPEKDKADLSASLKSSGIYTSQDLQGLLKRWKNQAIELERKQQSEQSPAKTFNHIPSIGF
jgi:hypothetical protein